MNETTADNEMQVILANFKRSLSIRAMHIAKQQPPPVGTLKALAHLYLTLDDLDMDLRADLGKREAGRIPPWVTRYALPA